jgi:hypothetical protein
MLDFNSRFRRLPGKEPRHVYNRTMKRFFFNLCGAIEVNDRLGIRFETSLQAFRAAQTIARDLSDARPCLRGKAWLALACEDSEDAYYLGIDGEGEASGLNRSRPSGPSSFSTITSMV